MDAFRLSRGGGGGTGCCESTCEPVYRINGVVGASGYHQPVSTSHYFSSPEGPLTRRKIQVELAGAPVTVFTANGIFSPDGIDKGTQVLLRHAPLATAEGPILDIGCGWGPIALTLALAHPEAEVWAVDINERARVLCAENASALQVSNLRVCAPEEVPEDTRFSTIWSNPPIRVGKPALHQLLQHWLPRLAAHGGEAHLVVQKNLGADSLLSWISQMLGEQPGSFTAERTATSKGFRILRIRRDD